MAVDKAAMLAALAQAGTAGLKAYQDAQTSIDAQKQEALRMALSGQIAQGAPAGAQEELSRIISQPYQSRAGQLTSNQASSQDWFARMQASGGQWADVMSGLQEAVTARAAAEAAARGSGGGGGGGGGGDEEDPYDWEKALRDTFGGTEKLRKAGIASEAERLAGPENPRALGVMQVQDEFGIPDFAIDTMFKGPKYMREGQDYLDELAATGGNYRQFKKTAQKQAKKTPGNQTRMNNYLKRQAKQVLPRGKKKKRR